MKNITLICILLLLSFAISESYSEYYPSNEEIEAIMDEYNLTYKDLEHLANQEISNNVSFSQISCNVFQEIIGKSIIGTELPDKLPFSNEILQLNIDGNFIGSIIIADNYIRSYSCQEEKITYNISITENFISEISELGDSDISEMIHFYKSSKSSGDLKINAIGFTKKVKLLFLNTAVSIGSLFIK